MSVGQIVIKLELDDKNFKGTISGAGDDLRRFERAVKSSNTAVKQAEGHHQSWGRTLRDSVIVLGLARHALENLNAVLFSFPRAVIRANAEIERMTALMRGLSTESDTFAEAQANAEQNVNYLFEMAKKTPFEINALTDSFVKFKAAGLDPTTGSFQALVDSVAKFGGTPESLKRASIAIQQMAGKGVISMEELRQQLGESVPTAIQLMSRGLGIGMGQLVDLISTGTVEARSALDAMFRQMAIENSGAAENMANTWDGLMNRLKTRLTLAAKEIGDAGYFEAAKEQLSFLVDDYLNRPEFSAAMYDLGKAMESMVRSFASGVGFIYQNFDAIQVLAVALGTLIVVKKTAELRENLLNAAKARGVALTKALTAQEQMRAQILRQQTAIVGGQLLMATNSFNHSMAESARRSAQLRTDLIQFGTTARNAGTLLKTFGTNVLGFFGGWVGVLGTLAAAAATWYFGIREEHNKTVELMADKPLMAMDDKERKAFVEKASRAKGLRAEIEKLQTQMEASSNGQGKYYKAQIEDLQTQLAAIEKVIGDANEAQAKLITMAKDNEERKVGAYVTVARNELMEATQALRNRYVEAFSKDLEKDGSKAAREANLRRRAQYEEQITSKVDEEIKRRQAALQKDINDRLYRTDDASKKEVAMLQDKYKALEGLREEMLGAFKEQGGLNLVDKDTKDKELNALDQFMRTRMKMLAKYQARVEDENPFMAEFESMNEMNVFSKSTPAEIQKVRDLMNELWETKKKFDAQNAEGKAFEESLARIGQLSNQINAKFLQRQNTNPWLRDQIEADKYKVKLQEVAAEVSTLTRVDQRARRAALEEVYRLSQQADAGARQSVVSQMEQATQEIQNGLLPGMKRIEAEYRVLTDAAWKWYAAQGQLNPEQLEAFYQYLDSLSDKMADETKTPIDELVERWADGTTQIQDMWATTMQSFVDALADGLIEGKLELDNFVKEFGRMVVKMQLQKAAAGMASGLGSALSGMFAGPSESYLPNEFANGGIMTSQGALELKTYSNGGIATGPQLALYGEGRQNEAYVPLPDGRTIPVTMNGGAGGMPAVQVNVINSSGQAVEAEQQGPGRFDGKSYVLDVVLTAASRPGKFRDGMKGALA